MSVRETLTAEEVTVKVERVATTGSKKWKVTLTFPLDVHIRRTVGRLTTIGVIVTGDSMAAGQLKREDERGD